MAFTVCPRSYYITWVKTFGIYSTTIKKIHLSRRRISISGFLFHVGFTEPGQVKGIKLS